MEKVFKQITQSGVLSLTIGILSVIFGVTIGVLSIVNGGLLLRDRKQITF